MDIAKVKRSESGLGIAEDVFPTCLRQEGHTKLCGWLASCILKSLSQTPHSTLSKNAQKKKKKGRNKR